MPVKKKRNHALSEQLETIEARLDAQADSMRWMMERINELVLAIEDSAARERQAKAATLPD